MTKSIGARGASLLLAMASVVLAVGMATPRDSRAMFMPDISEPQQPLNRSGQIAPETPITGIVDAGATSTLSLALVAVPDPRVPRHRRGYDLVVASLIKGMLDQGYVLDRYGFPWQNTLDGKDGGREGRLQINCQFGVMLFRRDVWRAPGSVRTGSAYRALYLIPEIATEGLAEGSMLAAMEHVRNQKYAETGALSAAIVCGEREAGVRDTANGGETQAEAAPPKPRSSRDLRAEIAYATHAMCARGATRQSRILLFGPRFSGSMSSLARIVGRAREIDAMQAETDASANPLPGVCAVSVSATAASNQRIGVWESDGLEFHPLAQTDEAKLAAIWKLAGWIGARRQGDIALFSEASSFGYEICGDVKARSPPPGTPAHDARALCDVAYQVVFPSNIADIRSERHRSSDDGKKSGLSRLGFSSEHIALDTEGGNSSEYPDSQQTRLTAAGNELELQRALVVMRNLRPKLIVVAATDVRDRLFLFDQLRQQVGNAQLVDMEADILLSHPQHLHASRGAITIASERLILYGRPNAWGLKDSRFDFASTDYQNLLRHAISGFDREAGGPWYARYRTEWDCDLGGADEPVLHVVGRDGLRPLACPAPQEQRTKAFWVPLAAGLGVLLLAISTPAGIAAMRRMRGLRAVEPPAELYRRLSSWSELSINASMPAIFLGMLLLFFAATMTGSDDLVITAIPTLSLFCWALSYQAGAYRHIDGFVDRDARSWRQRWWILDVPNLMTWIAMSLLFGGLCLVVQGHIGGDPIFTTALTRMGYSIVNGMAIAVALVVAILALLFADSSLAIATAVSRRNRQVMVEGLGLADSPAQEAFFARLFDVRKVPISPQMLLGTLVLIVCTIAALPLRSTVYGELASMLAFVAVIALSLIALSFFANAIRMKRRVLYLAYVVRTIAMRRLQGVSPPVASGGKDGEKASEEGKKSEGKKSDDKKAEAIGLWSATDGLTVRFAATPAVSSVTDAGAVHMELLREGEMPKLIAAVAALRPQPDVAPAPIECRTRIALYLIFASEVSQIRWATFSGAISSLAVAAFAYCYPVTGSDWFVLFNLILLAATGLFAGHSATELERDEALSNLLCNRTAKLEANSSLFRYIAFPFVLLAVMLAIMNVPGVMSWGDGIFKALLNLVGGGSLLG